MEDYVQAFLTGSAIGGLSIMMFEANKFVLKRLWDVNCIAAKLAWEMSKRVLRGQIERQLERAADEGCLKVVVKIESESESESES